MLCSSRLHCLLHWKYKNRGELTNGVALDKCISWSGILLAQARRDGPSIRLKECHNSSISRAVAKPRHRLCIAGRWLAISTRARHCTRQLFGPLTQKVVGKRLCASNSVAIHTVERHGFGWGTLPRNSVSKTSGIDNKLALPDCQHSKFPRRARHPRPRSDTLVNTIEAIDRVVRALVQLVQHTGHLVRIKLFADVIGVRSVCSIRIN